MRRQTQRSPIKSSIAFNKKIQEKLRTKKLLSIHQSIVNNSIDIDEIKEWPISRGYKEYSDYFDYGINKHGLGTSIFEFLKKRFKQTKERVSILDLGCGEGNFLSDIKQMLNGEKIPSKTESISLVDNISEKNKLHINKKNVIPVAEHKLTDKYDFIVDLNGAINMELEVIRKELILKYAYSLKPGGIMVINVICDVYSKKLKSIIAHLQKQGFVASFYKKNNSPASSHKYNTLIIRRVK